MSGATDDHTLHPEDTEERNLKDAAACIVSAKNANRTYIFPMFDRIDIAFATAKNLSGATDSRIFQLDYHTGLSLDFTTARILRDNLTRIFDLLEEQDGVER